MSSTLSLQGGTIVQNSDRCRKMGSLLLEAEITGTELVGQLKAGAKDKKKYETQIEKVSDSTSTKVHVCA